MKCVLRDSSSKCCVFPYKTCFEREIFKRSCSDHGRNVCLLAEAIGRFLAQILTLHFLEEISQNCGVFRSYPSVAVACVVVWTVKW